MSIKDRKSSSGYDYDKRKMSYRYKTMSQRKEEKKRIVRILLAIIIFVVLVVSLVFLCFKTSLGGYLKEKLVGQNGRSTDILSVIPEYDAVPYVEVNGNVPYFDDEDKTTDVFENYSELDSLGRCGIAYANICRDVMPENEREDIGNIYPTGWINNEYDIVDQRYLYNRCHLIGFQLAGENANEKNLITGTRYFNVEGMLPFEDEVAMYIYRTNNHVLYRVTPVFEADDLVAKGVEIEAYSVEDNGEGVSFNVFVYNVQPGIEIDYRTGENWKGKDYEKYK